MLGAHAAVAAGTASAPRSYHCCSGIPHCRGHDPAGSEPLALDPRALHLAGAANGFRGLTGAALGRLFVMPPQLHLAENPLPLHLLLERLQRLVDIVVTDENLHLAACSFLRWHPRRSEAHETTPLAVVRARGVPYNMRPRRRQCGFGTPFWNSRNRRQPYWTHHVPAENRPHGAPRPDPTLRAGRRFRHAGDPPTGGRHDRDDGGRAR